MAKIKFVVAGGRSGTPAGNVTSETNGVKGSKCLSVDKFLYKMGEVAIQKSHEFYEDAQDNDVMINTVQS